MFVGVVLGIATSNKENAYLFPVVIVYIIMATGDIQWILRQIIVIEGFMVSVERILQFREL